MEITKTERPTTTAWWIFRIALFSAAASLAAYIPFKYATQLHAVDGFYAFLFPLSGILALAGITVALRPRSTCDCGAGIRAGVGSISILWLGTGMICTPSLAEHIASSPISGLFATFQMLAQHVFLSLSLIAFAFFPREVLTKFGVLESSMESNSDQSVEPLARKTTI